MNENNFNKEQAEAFRNIMFSKRNGQNNSADKNSEIKNRKTCNVENIEIHTAKKDNNKETVIDDIPDNSIDNDDSAVENLKKKESEKKENTKKSEPESFGPLNKKLQIILSAVFSAVIVLFFVAGLISPDRIYSETENRSLASFPSLSISNILSGRFMSGFEKYMSDQFVFRDEIVSAKSLISRILGSSEVNGVYVGKNDRLYKVPAEFNEERIDKTVNAMSKFSSECKIVNQFIMLVPNATEIADNDLPDLLKCHSQKEQTDKIFSKIPGKIQRLDVYSALENHENKDELYLKTDHHWTAHGAYEAFGVFARSIGIPVLDEYIDFMTLSNSFYGTLSHSSGIYYAPDVIEACIPSDSEGTYVVFNADTQTKSSSVFDLSKLDSANQYEVFFGGNFSKLEITGTNSSEKNILIFKDSYANSFIPLLTPYFHKIVVIDPRYFTDDINTVLEDTEFTHLLFLYNVNTFLEDTVLKDVLA